MKRLKNIIIVFFLISNCYYFGNPFENCFLCSYFFGGRNVIKQNDESYACKSKKFKVDSANKEVSENTNFSINGLDIYWLDDFSEDSLDKYKQIIYDDWENKNIGERLENRDNIIKTKEGAWIWHLYKKKEGEGSNTDLITSIAEFVSTTGGNNFDWVKSKDETLESIEGRHNKNVFIIKLKDKNSILFKKAIFTFRQFVNMSYCPAPIIFTGDFKYDEFEEDLEKINNEFTKTHNKGNTEIGVGDVDFNEPIDGKTCFYIKQDENFVNKVVENLELAAAFHNTKGENTGYDTFNIAIVGAKRAGKSTLTTRLLNKLCGKTGNDKRSVSDKIGKFYHKEGKDIPIAVIDVPGFEIGKDYDVQFKNWIVKNEEDDRTKVHAVIYLINANNLPNPSNFGDPLTDPTTREALTNGELFLPQEVKVFKLLKKKQIPVVFCIARSKSVENGYKYLRKYFGDLTLIPKLSNYDSKEKNWVAEDQWPCCNWTRGTILQLKADNENGLFGLVRLLTCIHGLYRNNKKYKNRLPEVFKQNDNLGNLFQSLKNEILAKEWNGKTFANDDSTGPLVSKKSRKDIVWTIFEKPLIYCMEQLHNRSFFINKFTPYAKDILNYVCAYDYSVSNDIIAKDVAEKIKSKFLDSCSSGKSLGFFGKTLGSLVKTLGSSSFPSNMVTEIIKASLPNKDFLKDL